MTQTLQAKNVTLRDLIDNFGLELVKDQQFFCEWQDNLPDITESEQQFLDKVQEGYLNLVEYPPLIEKTIQIAVLAPIFFLAGFYLPPFHIQAEQSIEIEAEDHGVIIRGQLDLLLLKDQFWIMVVESKRATFSIEAGLSQLLSYMLASPDPSRPGFGLVASGNDFIFVKLVQGKPPLYATSDQFAIRNHGDLYQVYKTLKRISAL